MKLSVIVCLNNTKKEALDRCLNSVFTSTLKDYEVVVIDDGSTVDYSQITEKYHPVYVKTPHRGDLAARTYGLMLAKGEYVTFLNPSEAVTFNYYESMVEGAQDCDIIMNGYCYKTENNFVCCEGDVFDGEVCFTEDEVLREYAKQGAKAQSIFALCNKVYKRSLLLTAKAELEKTDAIMKKASCAEDMLINFFAFKNAKKFKNINTGYCISYIYEENSTEEKANQIDTVSANFDVMLGCTIENKYAEEIKENIKAWKGFVCRGQYASVQNDKSLCEHVKNAYKVTEIAPLTKGETKCFLASKTLGKNFDGVDKILRFIYKNRKDVSINYDVNDKYVIKSLELIAKQTGITITPAKNAPIVIQKEKTSFFGKLFKKAEIVLPKMMLAQKK